MQVRSQTTNERTNERASERRWSEQKRELITFIENGHRNEKTRLRMS
jgi:hypothetical protein